MITNQK